MRVAYLDCFSGLSGDMFLGALVDAGLSASDLEAAVAGLPVRGCRLSFGRVRRGAIVATRVRVQVTEPQPARRLEDILAVLEGSRLSPSVLARSRAVFSRLVAAEAKVHGVPPEEAHLHEVGAVDALVDVVGAVAGLERLGIEQLWVSPLPCPRGWVAAAHGRLPVPAPAVLELLRGVPVYGVEEETELVTPTGAALAVELAAGFGPLPPMRLERVGYGAGERELTHPNVLRLLLGETDAVARPPGADPAFLRPETVAVVEAAIDDMNGEWYPYLAEGLRRLGALDVYFAPVYMKKGRPGVLVTALVPPEAAEGAAALFVTESTTLGVRWRLEQRLVAPRDWLTVEVGGREVRVKYSAVSGSEPGEKTVLQVAPEYEDCHRVAEELGLPLKEVYLLAQGEAWRRLKPGV
ncbi:MAG: nickel pincer cofactor biosynthesis protein LarC [Moorellales bacterium]